MKPALAKKLTFEPGVPQVAIDATWSAMRFRPKKPTRR